MGRLLTLVMAFTLVGIGFGGVASAAEATEPTSKLTYQIRPRHTDMCLESSQTTAVVRQQTCGAPSIGSQRWTVVETSTPGVVRIVEPISGRCLDVRAAGTTNGTPVGVLACEKKLNQVFTLTLVSGSDYYRIQPQHAPGTCLDVKTDVPEEGAPLQLWECLDGQANQYFRFVSP